MPKKHKKVEWSKRPYDGKLEKWVWFTDVELGIIKHKEAKRFPHLGERGRWVITEIRSTDTSLKNANRNKKHTTNTKKFVASKHKR